MSSKLLDHVDRWIFVKNGPTISLCLFGQHKLKKIPPKLVNISAKFGSSHFKSNVQIRNYFENIISIVFK